MPNHQKKSLLRRPEVEQRTGLKRSTIYLRMSQGTFPKPVSLGRAVAWVEDEIEEWINARIESRQIKAA